MPFCSETSATKEEQATDMHAAQGSVESTKAASVRRKPVSSAIVTFFSAAVVFFSLICESDMFTISSAD